jgi:hypothetical protein
VSERNESFIFSVQMMEKGVKVSGKMLSKSETETGVGFYTSYILIVVDWFEWMRSLTPILHFSTLFYTFFPYGLKKNELKASQQAVKSG